MQFYASDDYLDVAARAYFPGQDCTVERVAIGGHVFRLLFVADRLALSDLNFIDYLEPLAGEVPTSDMRQVAFAPTVAQEVINTRDWRPEDHQDHHPAPFIDWGKFETFQDYEDLLRSRSKRLLKDQQRRGRRLAELFDDLSFQRHDMGDDVLPMAFKWKTQQFHDTGAPNYLADERNRRHFELLREAGLLTASTLRGDGRLLAVWLGFIHDGIWSGWIFTHDKADDFRKYSLGHQLLHRMLEDSKRQGHRQFDFSIGDEEYKWFYSSHVRVLAPLGTPPLTVRLDSAARQARRRIRGVLERNPAALRAALALSDRVRRIKNRSAEWLRKGRAG